MPQLPTGAFSDAPHTFAISFARLTRLAMLDERQSTARCTRAKVKPIRALLVLAAAVHDYAVQKELLSKGISQRAHVEFQLRTTQTKVPRISIQSTKGYLGGRF